MEDATQPEMPGWLMSIVRDVIRAVWKAWQVRLLRKSDANLLPPVSDTQAVSVAVRDRIRTVVGALVLCLFFWKPGRCYYRSYAIAYVLRKRGVPLILNLGCNNYLELTGKAKAHCWLTLDGKPFAEKEDPFRKYFIPMGCLEGQVHYWLGSHIDTGPNKKEKNPKITGSK